LIANAGITDQSSVYNFHRRDAPIEDLPSEPDTTCTDTDFKGTMYGTTLATHFMRHNPHGKGGKIVVTGSMVGIYPYQTFPEYCSAKAATHQWVKTTGPILKLKENITVNCVMPGPVETPIAKGFSKAFFPEQMTSKSQLLSAYDLFLEDTENTRSGQTIEAAHDKLVDWGHPEYKSGAFAKRTGTLFEPWFEAVHGEKSGLPCTLQEWPDQSHKILAVTGATGTQGGGVINVMKKTPGWKIRALTRNVDSDAAKKLAAEGIEVVHADWDDESSLAKAFQVRE
jgi:NAD(P)-dependent dehydrogenase (short-subunit alcohol dehydrogenase family)